MTGFLFKQIQAHLSVFSFSLVSVMIFSMSNTSPVNGICWEPPFAMFPFVSLDAHLCGSQALEIPTVVKLIAIQVIGLFGGNEE